MSNEEPRHEYSEVCNNLRHYSSLRFAIFSVYFAVIGGLSYVIFGGGQVESPAPVRTIAKIGGLLITLLFCFYEWKIQSIFVHYLKVAESLELTLKYSQISTRPRTKLKTYHATMFVYLLLVVFWLYVILWKV